MEDEETVDDTPGESRKETTVEEVWFSGCHSDVGGGSVPDTETHVLSSISLRWMLRECTKLQLGLLFDTEALRHAGIPPSTLNPLSALQQGSIKEPKLPEASPAITTLSGMPGLELPSGRVSYESHTSEDHSKMPADELNWEEASEPMHDEARKWWWWPLELMPLVQTYQDDQGNWRRVIGCVLV